jgi:hypothetical protein
MKGFSTSSFAVCIMLLCSSSMPFLKICFLQLMKLRSLANGLAEIWFACRAFRSVEPSCARQCCCFSVCRVSSWIAAAALWNELWIGRETWVACFFPVHLCFVC